MTCRIVVPQPGMENSPCSGSVESQLLDQEASPEGDKHVLPTCSTAEVEGIAIVSDFVVFPVIQK